MIDSSTAIHLVCGKRTYIMSHYISYNMKGFII